MVVDRGKGQTQTRIDVTITPNHHSLDTLVFLNEPTQFSLTLIMTCEGERNWPAFLVIVFSYDRSPRSHCPIETMKRPIR
eukprot:scaffold400814_cov15-Prasinocladus_malaysianus.AAC.1